MSSRHHGAVSGLEFLDGVMLWALRLAAAAIVLITGYYLYATAFESQQLFHGLIEFGRQMSPQDFQRHVANLQLLMRILLLASVVVIVAGLFRYYHMAELGVVFLLVGGILAVGMPLFVDNFGGFEQPLPANLQQFGNPRTYLKEQYILAGVMYLGVGALQTLVHAIIYAIFATRRRPQAEEEAARTAASVRKSTDRYLGRCWELPFCRDTEKKLCPIRHSKKPCWRTGRGCYCDQNVILTISGGGAAAIRRGAVSRPKTLSEKRAQCLQCPIYLHRQQQKYRLLAPVALISVAIGFVLARDVMRGLYPGAINALGKALAGLTFGPRPQGVPAWATELASNNTLAWMVVIVLGVLLLAYILHSVEWVLFRLGL